MLALEHAEHGDSMHTALRVVDPRTGTTIAEQIDEGMALVASCWSPIPGDQRLIVTHEREGEERPAIWDPRPAPGPTSSSVSPGRWKPWIAAGRRLGPPGAQRRGPRPPLSVRLSADGLLARSITTRARSARPARPDGDVWFRLSSGERPPVTLDSAGADVVRADGDPAPAGRLFHSWHFDNGEGDRVHGFYVTPEGSGPFPVMMFVHGGPTGQDTDAWDPEVLAYVDMGFAVGMVNYRGSTGYGRVWRDRLIGDIGGPELVDVNAGLADLVARGVADPGRAVVGGWSWGGYITVMEPASTPPCGWRVWPAFQWGTTSSATRTSRPSCRPTIGRCSAALPIRFPS